MPGLPSALVVAVARSNPAGPAVWPAPWARSLQRPGVPTPPPRWALARQPAFICAAATEAHWCQPLAADATFQPACSTQALLAGRYARWRCTPALQAQF